MHIKGQAVELPDDPGTGYTIFPGLDMKICGNPANYASQGHKREYRPNNCPYKEEMSSDLQSGHIGFFPTTRNLLPHWLH
jgi:hypothetical protein